MHTLTVEHVTSGARRSLELLVFSDSNAQVWWPLCGVHLIQIAGQQSGMLYAANGNPTNWKLIASDLARLRRHRPASLYEGGKVYDVLKLPDSGPSIRVAAWKSSSSS